MTGRVQGKLRISTIVDPSFIRLAKLDVGFFLGAFEDYAQTHNNHPDESLDDFQTRKLTEFNYRVSG